MRKVYMPSGRASADRRIFGCWMYQRGAALFIGEKNPNYWIHDRYLKEEGLEWWVEHLRRRRGFVERSGWTWEEAERDFRLLAREVHGL